MAPTPRPVLDPTTFEQAIATLQQRLDQMQANLAQQNKLATLGMVTAVLAHEFNNILTPMISYTKFALSDKADEALRNKALTKALSGAERLANISQSLLGFARGNDNAVANVQQAITETLACLSRELSKDGITLCVDMPQSLTVAMNAGQLQQVLMNLVVNARSAMLGSSTAQRSRGGVKRLSIRGSVIKNGKIAEVSVADTGPGIPEEVLPRVFDPFFSTKKRCEESEADEAMPRGGTGLGLTICQELIASAGGTIRVHSEPGNGATFIIELPLGEASAA
ncbi:MAG TPA: ATP-binding protein [Phycisphaerae bacterium]|nr:ATP-binding protein [Phycisphaerae bacterium]